MKLIKQFSLLTLVCVLFLSLVACAPKNAEKAEEKLEKAGYEVEVADSKIELAILEAFGIKNVEAAVAAYSENGEEFVMAFLFEEKADAKEAMESIGKYFEDELGDDYSGSVKRSGKWIYTGTEQGMKDFA